MAFQYRSLLPVMKELSDTGAIVYVLSRGRFSEQRIRKHPRAFGDITRSSLSFVCTQIGLSSTFLKKVRFIPEIRRISFPFNSFYASMDLFVSTTKGFPWLNQMKEHGRPRIAVGYQNFLGTYFAIDNESFPSEAPPQLEIEQQLRSTCSARWEETGLPFMDAYFDRKRTGADPPRPRVLLLHPGGYRDVITRMGENRRESYRLQREFYEQLLMALPPGIGLDVKMHPLAARYHDLPAHREFAIDLNIGLVDGFLGDLLFDYKAILSVGSSAFVEVIPFGRALWILDYFSRERTQLYSSFPSLLIADEEQLSHVLQHNLQPEFADPFEKAFMRRLGALADGKATKRVLRIIGEMTEPSGRPSS